ncbi:DUF2975 domain-containing protein [Agarivorans sp. Alg241-V36]|uniref:DUF2975 domain-containing protein n=1 Tax=Agarivorans sp. Alg241-V36 TaxID=2305992 RepID=UPI0013D0DE12|nr:DUF2975 domain-containing protein [Agarivorans sp. Alg241-V36]
MQSLEAISIVGKRMRLILWGLVALILICLVGFPSELGLDIEPMKHSPWVFSFHTVMEMLFGYPELIFEDGQLIDKDMHFAHPEPLSLTMRLVAVAIFFATSLIMASLIWQIDRLFLAYSKGKVFTQETTRSFQYIGWALVALFTVNSVASYLIEQLMFPMKMPNGLPFPPPPPEDLFGFMPPPPPEDLFGFIPPPHEWVSLEYIQLDFPLLLAGLFMIMVAHVMKLGMQIQADVDATI